METDQPMTAQQMAQYMEGRLAAEKQQYEAALAELRGQLSASLVAPVANTLFELKDPDVFRGTQDSSTVRDWLYGAEAYFDATGVADDHKRVEFAALQFRAEARTWWRSLGSARPTTWADFKTVVAEYFQPAQSVQFLREQLYNLRQIKSAQAFVDSFKALAVDIPDLGQAEALTLFRKGLKAEVALHVAYGNPKSFDEAAKLAVAIDTILFNARRGQGGAQGSGRPQRSYAAVASGAGSHAGPTPIELGAVHSSGLKPLTEAEREQLRREGACFRCRKPGHLSKDCPNAVGKGNAKRQ